MADENPKPKKRKKPSITCGAKTSDGSPCELAPMKGRNRCRLHGGASPIGGPTHPRFKTGLHSKFLPGKLGERFIAAYNDPELLSHRKNAALFDTRVQLLAERLFTGESGKLWATLRKYWESLEAAQTMMREAGDAAREAREAVATAANDAERDAAQRRLTAAEERRAAATKQFGDSLQAIGKTIGKGVKDESNWRELLDVSHEASAMKLRETKRLEAERMMVPVTEVLTIVSALYGFCREASESLLPPDTSRQLLLRVGAGVNQLLNHRSTARDLRKIADRGQDAQAVERGVIDAASQPVDEGESQEA